MEENKAEKEEQMLLPPSSDVNPMSETAMR